MSENEILQIVENINTSNRDITVRKLKVEETNIYLLFIMQITDRTRISEDIIKPILSYRGELPLSSDLIGNSIIFTDNMTIEEDKEKILNDVLDGKTVILVPEDKNYISVNTLKVEKRNVDLPQIETALRSPKDSFTENLDTNLSLIRYRIKDPGLTIEHLSIGERTKTNISLIYLKDVVNTDIYNRIKKGLLDIKVDGILDSGQLQKLVVGRAPLFPEIGIAERSDSACGHILDGRVCIMTNGSNLALLAPFTFMEFMDSGEDHYDNTVLSIFIKFLRFLAMFLTLTLSSLYVAVVAFHSDVLPSQYILTLATSRVAVPVNAFLEALVMELVGELLREGSLRLPKQIGPALGIVGTIVIGQAAVSAGLVSPLMVIIIALSSMTSFAAPDYGIMNPIRLLKYMLLILTSIFGIFGFMMGINLIAIRVISATSFGVPYSAPAAPFNLQDIKSFIFPNIILEKERPSYLKTKDKKRK